MNISRLDFSNAIKNIAASHGYANLHAIADALKIDNSSLSRHITKLHNDGIQIPSKFSTKLSALFGMTHEALSNQITINERTALKENDTYEEQIIGLIEGLEKGDGYTLITSDTPWEFQDTGEFWGILQKAIKKGVYFEYIFPSNNDVDFVEKFKKLKQGSDINWMHLGENWKNFKEELFKNQDYGTGIDEVHNRNLKSYYLNDLIFMQPWSKYLLINYRSAGLKGNDVTIGYREIHEYVDEKQFSQKIFRISKNELQKLMDSIKNKKEAV